MNKASFRDCVLALMAEVPAGQVTTYGDLAALAGQANAARMVGGIAHFGSHELPWHRFVNRFGGLAIGFHGGREAQAQLLAKEGVACQNFMVTDFKERRWQPDPEKLYR